MHDDFKYVVEVSVAGGTGAQPGKRVLLWCVSGVGAWKVASALSPRLKAQVERFECDLSVYLVLDDDRVRYEFPIKDRELEVILEKQYGTSATKKAATGVSRLGLSRSACP